MATLLSTLRDRISELPDDILSSIISPMEMKEAAKTSILSRRWRYLWAKRIHLDFDYEIILPKRNTYYYTAVERSKYMNWVTQVVSLHCGPCIDTFRVWFPFLKADAHHIDKWVRFALSKKVKNLVLDSASDNPVYTLAAGFNMPISESLVSLRLARVDVSGDFIEYLLSKCRLLERLHVEGSNTLVRFKVESRKLKYLTLNCCRNIQDIEIEAADNLIYFDYYDVSQNTTNLVLKSVPLLVEVAFGGSILFASSFFHKHPHLPLQISKLFLDLGNLEEIPRALVLPTFRNVRQLTLEVECYMTFDFVGIRRVLDAFPMVHELKVQIFWADNVMASEALMRRRTVDAFTQNDVQIQGRSSSSSSFRNLKVLHVVGFMGCKVDVKLVLYFAGLAYNLETIKCDCCGSIYAPKREIIEASRSQAAKLVKLLPPNINMVIV